MSFTRPVIVSGSTRLTKELIDGITQGIANADAAAELALAAVAESSTPALTRVRLARRYEDPVRLVVFADSRGEGVTPNPATEGITGWDKTFPSLVAQMMRNELGLPAGGRGWIPLALTDDAAAYRFTVSSFEAGTPAPVVGDTGVPGSQWMVPERTIRVPLSAGCTSVALVSAPSGGGGYATKLTGQKAGRVRDWGQDGASGVLVDSLNDPGTYVDVTSGGGGFFALGLIEYVGDETAGVQVLNFAVSGIDSAQMAVNVGKPAMSALLDWYSADVSVVALGANDVGHAVSPAQTVTALDSILDASGGAVVAVTAIPAGSPTSAWNATNAAIRGLSATIADIVADVPASVDAAAAGLFLSDGTHFTLSGNAAQADAIHASVMGHR